MTETPDQIARDGSDACRETLACRDHAAQLDLIPRSARALGIPGYEVIGYDDRPAQCVQGFGGKRVASARSQGPDILEYASFHIRFTAVASRPSEILPTKEGDGPWRVTKERLLESANGPVKTEGTR
jgi:hypothetical protein